MFHWFLWGKVNLDWEEKHYVGPLPQAVEVSATLTTYSLESKVLHL